MPVLFLETPDEKTKCPNVGRLFLSFCLVVGCSHRRGTGDPRCEQQIPKLVKKKPKKVIATTSGG
jgi:hypothetical protein